MVLLAYGHGLRASELELVDLRWDQVESSRRSGSGSLAKFIAIADTIESARANAFRVVRRYPFSTGSSGTES
jgi:hypothetical protein